MGFPEWSARYNAIGSFERETEVASRVARQLPSAGNSAAFREFSWRFVNIVARALIAMGKRPDFSSCSSTSRTSSRCSSSIASTGCRARRPNWRSGSARGRGGADAIVTSSRRFAAATSARSRFLKYLERQQLYEPILDGLRSAVRYDKTYFDKIVASLLPLLEKLTTGKVAELIAPD